MTTWDDFDTAQKIEQTIRKIVADEINKQRPASRYAIVDSIDTEDRSVMARFIGETEAVRIPYLDVIPSATGQEIKVSGVGSDRAVEAIRGTSDSEARVAELEAEAAKRAPAFGEWYRANDTTLASGLNKLIWTDTAFDPVGSVELITSGTEIRFTEEGYYRIEAQLTFSSTEVQNDHYLQCLPATGSNFDFGRSGFKAQIIAGDGNFFADEITIGLFGIRHFNSMDKVCVNFVAGTSGLILFGGFRSKVAVQKLYGGPLIDI